MMDMDSSDVPFGEVFFVQLEGTFSKKILHFFALCNRWSSFLLINQPADTKTKCVTECVDNVSSNGKMPQQSSLIILPTRVN